MRFSACVLLAGCGAGADATPVDAVAVRAPALGKADGADRADRGCQIVLRTLSRTPHDGGYVTDPTGHDWVWQGTVQVAPDALARGARAALLYHPASNEPWYEAPVTVAADGSGRVELSANTKPLPGMSGTSIFRSRMEVVAVLVEPSGARVFDHNRVPGDFDNLALVSANSFAIADDASVCPVGPRPVATLEFLSTFTERQHGAIAPGGQLVVDYALGRLPACRWSRAGYQLWDIEATARFSPGGQTVTSSVTRVTTGDRAAAPWTLDIPADATGVELWFHNFSAANTCDSWDSHFGQNYRFAVLRPSAAPTWAGDLGNAMSRECTHRDGLDEPVVIDEYIRERACKRIDVDVYAPGTTDSAELHPERLAAEVQWNAPGAAPTTAWLDFDSRVGNNYRFRWEVPYEVWALGGDRFEFAFRFSTDGARWLHLGATLGDGAPPRSIVRR